MTSVDQKVSTDVTDENDGKAVESAERTQWVKDGEKQKVHERTQLDRHRGKMPMCLGAIQAKAPNKAKMKRMIQGRTGPPDDYKTAERTHQPFWQRLSDSIKPVSEESWLSHS